MSDGIKNCGAGLREFLADYFSSATDFDFQRHDIETCVSTQSGDETRHHVAFDTRDHFVLVERLHHYDVGPFQFDVRTAVPMAANPQKPWAQFFLEEPHLNHKEIRQAGCGLVVESKNIKHYIGPDGVEDAEPDPFPDMPQPEPEPVEVAEPDQGPELPLDVAPDPEPQAEEEPDVVVEPDEIAEPDGGVEPDPVMEPEDVAEPDKLPEADEVAEPEPDEGPELPLDVAPEVEPEDVDVAEPDELPEANEVAEPEPDVQSDQDDDGVPDQDDNCPAHYNPSQADSDKNGIGDSCEQCIIETCAGSENPDSCEDAAPISDFTGDVGQPCSVRVGICQTTDVSVCLGDGQEGYQVVCPAQPGEPMSTELCNEIDDDCDGATDENFPVGESCVYGQSACAVQGVYICAGLTSIKCNAKADFSKATPEVCDDHDNDCDGFTDEDSSGVGMVTQACEATAGICEAGFQYCVDGKFSGDCVGAVPGVPESCNGVDDSCNGVTDEGTFGDCTVGAGFCVSQGALICTDATLDCNAPVITPLNLGFSKFCEYNFNNEGCDATPDLYFDAVFDNATGLEVGFEAFLDNMSHKTVCFLNQKECELDCFEFVPQSFWIQGIIMNWDAAPNSLGVSLLDISGTTENYAVRLATGNQFVYGLHNGECDGGPFLDCPEQPE